VPVSSLCLLEKVVTLLVSSSIYHYTYLPEQSFHPIFVASDSQSQGHRFQSWLPTSRNDTGQFVFMKCWPSTIIQYGSKCGGLAVSNGCLPLGSCLWADC